MNDPMNEPVKQWPRARFWALIEEWGLLSTDVFHVEIDSACVHVSVYRRDDEGRRYMGPENEAASVTWDIPLR
jgi:hypothetical protein